MTETSTTYPPVSPATENALRSAMERLAAGKPQRTDGRLIKQNLWREAGVSRATMNRATTVLAEWDAMIAATGSRTSGEARRDSEIAKLRRDLRKAREDRAELQRRLDAAATVIAALHHERTLLHQELAQATSGKFIPITGQRGPLPQS